MCMPAQYGKNEPFSGFCLTFLATVNKGRALTLKQHPSIEAALFTVYEAPSNFEDLGNLDLIYLLRVGLGYMVIFNVSLR